VKGKEFQNTTATTQQ